jgi:hypothetical protein
VFDCLLLIQISILRFYNTKGTFFVPFNSMEFVAFQIIFTIISIKYTKIAFLGEIKPFYVI